MKRNILIVCLLALFVIGAARYATYVMNYATVTEDFVIIDGATPADLLTVNVSSNIITLEPTGLTDIVVNEGSADTDFRIEGNGDANLFALDAANDKIGIGNAAPDEKLHIEGNAQIDNAAGDSNSYKLYLKAHLTAGDETQTSALYTAFGADPYLVIAAPNATGAETAVCHIDHDSIVFATDDTVDIGATGANRPKDIFMSGDLAVEDGTVTASGLISSSGGGLQANTTVVAGTGITATTGTIAASAGAITASTTITAGTGITSTTGNITASAGTVIDSVNDVRMPQLVSAADPGEPYDCTITVRGYRILVDDTDDGTGQIECVCLGVDDVINYEWQRADDNTTQCPSLP
jgi:hypothetical protein